MLIAHYEHRLPADYDLDIIRNRATQRGALWNDVPELYFKAFLLREAGKFGAAGHSYSSLYLWRNEAAFADFLSSRFRSVIDSFGRPRIDTRFALDARKGQGRRARLAYVEEIDIPGNADLAEIMATEIERNREVASRPAIVAATVGVDAQQWRITRVQLTEGELDPGSGAAAYQVLYLASPLLDELPR